MISRSPASVVLSAALLASLCGTCRGDGISLDMFSARSGGRAGVNAAYADNGAILLENPSAMVNLAERARFDLDAAILVGRFSYSDPDGSDSDNFRFPQTPSIAPGLSYMRKSEGGEYAWGVGAFTTAGFGTNYELESPFAGEQTYRSLALVTKMLVGGSYEVAKGLSIGANAGLAVSYAELNAPYYFQTGALRGVPTLVDFKGSGFAPTFTVGAQYKVGDKTTIGLAYTEETRFILDGNSSTEVYGLGPTPIPSNFNTKMDLAMPRSILAGIKHDFTPRHHAGFDFEWRNWHGSSKALDFQFSNASNPAFAGPTITDSLPLHWKDSYNLKFGYEYDLTEKTTLRAGYGYHNSITPNDTVNPLIPVQLEHNFTLGYSHLFETMSLDLAYILSLGRTEHVGQSAIVGGDFDNSSFREEYHTLYAGLGWHF